MDKHRAALDRFTTLQDLWQQIDVIRESIIDLSFGNEDNCKQLYYLFDTYRLVLF